MQAPNLGIDPANNLWSSNSPNNNLFSSISSPEGSGSNNDASISANTVLNPNIYPAQEIGGVMGGKMESAGGGAQVQNQGSQLSADSGFGGGGSESNAGEVFMVS
jgi:hypothetical protein